MRVSVTTYKSSLKSVTLKTLSPIFLFHFSHLILSFPHIFSQMILKMEKVPSRRFSLLSRRLSSPSRCLSLPSRRLSSPSRHFRLPFAVLQKPRSLRRFRSSFAALQLTITTLQLSGDASSFCSWRRFILCPFGYASSATLHPLSDR